MSQFKGLGTALVTPFRSGVVDMPAYESLLTRQSAAGVDFIVALGTTAETPCLSDNEKSALLALAVEIFKGPVMAGVGTNSLSGTLHNMELLDKFNPAAWLVVVPYYNKPMQNGLYEYFKAVAASTTRDIFLYNIPGRTGVNIEPETVKALSEIPNIKGIKDANTDATHLMRMRRETPDDFMVLSGNDDQWVDSVRMGFDGLISVASNIVPETMTRLRDAMVSGNWDRAFNINDSLQDLYKACFVESNPIPVKAALSLLGYCSAEMRLPLTQALPSTKTALAKALNIDL